MNMCKTALNIIIIENSFILYEGLVKALLQCGVKARITHAESVKEVEKALHHTVLNIIIINPASVQYNLKEFQCSRNTSHPSRWIGFVYQFFEEQLLANFDGLINVFDTPEKIEQTIQHVISAESENPSETNEKTLSEREIEVLQQLALGLSNKEIADKLSISINTAITHRKNISQKTGIKTVSGLTIYAVVNKYIAL